MYFIYSTQLVDGKTKKKNLLRLQLLFIKCVAAAASVVLISASLQHHRENIPRPFMLNYSPSFQGPQKPKRTTYRQ